MTATNEHESRPGESAARQPEEEQERADRMTESPQDLPPSIAPQHRPEALAIRTATEAQERRTARLRKAGTRLFTFIAIIAAVALFKTFVLQFFAIPSESMEDTLEVGDRVAVTMFDTTDIHRGDIVVFRDPGGWLSVEDPTGVQGFIRDALIFTHLLPQDSGHHLIKRVIGLPGDHVTASAGGAVYVNGVQITEPYVKEGRAASEIPFDVVVPEGSVWVMGDNRSNSSDSRYHMGDGHSGFVPASDIVGVAKAVVWPIGEWKTLDSGRSAFAQVPAPSASPEPTKNEGA